VQGLLLTLGLLLGSPNAGSGQVGQDADGVTVLELRVIEELDQGRMAMADGVAPAEGVRYSVQDLDLMQPVAVALVAADAGQPVRLEIAKGEWDQVFRSCETDGSGACEVRFRTQGNFGIRVLPASASSSSYQLAVWVGDEARAVPTNVIVPRDGGTTGSGLGLIQILLGVIAAALVVLVVLGIVLVQRRRAGGPA
jgi:hypothetical protein